MHWTAVTHRVTSIPHCVPAPHVQLPIRDILCGSSASMHRRRSPMPGWLAPGRCPSRRRRCLPPSRSAAGPGSRQLQRRQGMARRPRHAASRSRVKAQRSEHYNMCPRAVAVRSRGERPERTRRCQPCRCAQKRCRRAWRSGAGGPCWSSHPTQVHGQKRVMRSTR